MSANYRNPNFLLPNEVNMATNPDLSVDRHSLYSMEFNGSSSYIDLTQHDLGTTNTISLWLNISFIVSGQTVLGEPSNAFKQSVIIEGNIIYIKDVANHFKGWNLSTSSEFSLNNWHHFGIVRSGSTVTFYIDGVDQGSPDTSSGAFTANTKFRYLGTNYPTNTQFLNGKIDEVAVFNTALTLGQIQALSDSKNSPINIMAFNPKPIAYYPLGEQARVGGNSNPNAGSSEWQFPNQSIQSTVIDFENSGSPGISQTGGRIDLESDINLGTQHTISLWIKLDPPSPAPNNLFTILGSNYTPNKYTLFLQGSSIYYKPINAANDQLALWTIPNTSSVFDSSWHNIILNRDGSTLSLYLDNNQLASSLNSITTGQASIDTIGANHPGISTNYYLNGKLSNVVTWNSDQSSEKDNIYNNGSPATSYTNTPTAWYKLNAANSSYAPFNANFNSALSFNGTGDKITLNSSVATGNNYSVSLWLNPKNVSSGNSYLFSDSTTSPFKGLALDQGSSTAGGFGNFYYYTGAVNIVNNTAILGDVWSHIVISFNITGQEIKFYVNGVLDKTSTSVANISSSINEFGIRSTGNAYNGKLSNISIWSTELNQTQVKEIYNNGTPETSISHSPVSWWKLDAGGTTITDYGSGGNNGTNNGATLVSSPVAVEQWVFTDSAGSNNATSTTLPTSALVRSDLQFESPYSNFSLDFDGANDYIDCTDISYFSGADRFSLSTWFKVDSSDDGSANRDIISKGSTSAGTTSFLLRKQKNSNGNKVQIAFDEGVTNFYSTTQIQNDIWYHLIIVYKGYESNNADRLNIYVDGVNSTASYTNTVPTTLVSSTQPLRIARWAGLATDFNGKIDEVAIWNTALTEAQVNQVYNNGLASDLTSLSPTNWWRLGEDAYFVNNNITIPNQITGGPSGTGSGTQTSMLVADAPGSYGSGSGVNLDIVDRIGEAPGTSPVNIGNSQSYNMIPDDRHSYVPGYTPAKVDNAFSMVFDGVNDYMDAGSSIGIIGTGVKTFSVWLKTSYTGGIQTILSTRDQSADNGWVLQINSTSIQFFNEKNNTNIYTENNPTLTDGVWHNIVIVRGGSTATNAIYQDGSPITLTINTENGTSPQSASNLSIGSTITSTSSPRFFNGNIDEVAIFDYALTPRQIKEDIYNASTTGKTADLNNNSNLTAPVAWYRMGD